MCLSATPGKVLELMHNPEFDNTAQKRVYGYLQKFIGNLTVKDTHTYLRFVTGSSVLPSSPLTTMFNNSSGLARRPIAHTCSNAIELSVSYATFDELENEIQAVLSDHDYSWYMDLY